MNELNINLTNSWKNAHKLKHKQEKVFRKYVTFSFWSKKCVSSIFDRKEDNDNVLFGKKEISFSEIARDFDKLKKISFARRCK